MHATPIVAYPFAPSSLASVGSSFMGSPTSREPWWIGEAEGSNKSYVSLVLRLALLAPGIVEAILTRRTDEAQKLDGL